MMFFPIGLIGGAVVLAALVTCGINGVRYGDLPPDARVSAWVSGVGQPDEPRPVLAATVRNPSAAPVLASARRYLMTAVVGQAGGR
jgi:hypothetical protein